MGRKRMYESIFEEFFKIKQFMSNNADLYREIHTQFMENLEKYFLSGVWAKRDIDRTLFLKAGQGLSTIELSKSMHISYNTLNARILTYTNTICRVLFNGNPLNTDILNSTDEVLTEYIKNIQIATINFNYYTSFNDEVIFKVQSRLNGNVTSTDYTKEDVYQVLLTYARFSQQSMESWFNELNPSALAYVTEQLNSTSLNKIKEQYMYMQNKSLVQKMTPKIAEQIAKATGDEFNEQ